MAKKTTKIGVVTTGHGPRTEYVDYHKALLQSLGADVEVVLRHALEGLTIDDLRPHIVDRRKPNIGAHVHVPGATGNQYGDGWDHPFIDLDFSLGRMQRAIDLLETDDKVDIVVLACAAEVPDDALRANTLLIHPRELMFDLTSHLVQWTRRRLRIGALVDVEHADMDHKDWMRRPWFSKIDFRMAPISGDVHAAAAALGKEGVDFAFYFGYGVGLAPFAEPDRLNRMEAAVGAPLIVPHRVTTLFLRNLVAPNINDATYMPAGWWKRA